MVIRRTIDSSDNPTVRGLRDLHTADGRRQQSAFLIEGKRLVAEAVAAGWPLSVALYDSRRAEADPELASLVARIPGALPASERALKQACDTVSPQGIVAAAGLPAAGGLIGLEEPLVLVLDGVGDPGNAGTLLRSALAAGVRTVLASVGTVDLFAPKVVRGGMGAHFRLRIGAHLAWPEIRKMLGIERATMVATADAGMPYQRVDWRRVGALVIGSEAQGPSAESSAAGATPVSIPLEAGVESLNAAVAGSVILFEAKRQREQGS